MKEREERFLKEKEDKEARTRTNRKIVNKKKENIDPKQKKIEEMFHKKTMKEDKKTMTEDKKDCGDKNPLQRIFKSKEFVVEDKVDKIVEFEFKFNKKLDKKVESDVDKKNTVDQVGRTEDR